MPKRAMVILSLALMAMLHLDWHLARPAHHRLSLDWSYHWIATALVFGFAGYDIARRWPRIKRKVGAIVFLAAVILAQFVEPVLEVAFYERRLGYSESPERWAVFFRTIAASTVTYWSALWFSSTLRREKS